MQKILSLLIFISISGIAIAQEPQNIIVPPNPDGTCAACKPQHLVFNIPTNVEVLFNPDNSMSLFQPIGINSSPFKLITSVAMELVYFEFIPESEDCLPCNKNSATFGNFSSGVIAGTTAVGAGTHSLTSTFLPPKNPGSFPASFNITLPPTVKCCDGMVRWCIRYIVSFDDCSVCSKVVCYEKHKTGMSKPIFADPNNKN